MREFPHWAPETFASCLQRRGQETGSNVCRGSRSASKLHYISLERENKIDRALTDAVAAIHTEAFDLRFDEIVGNFSNRVPTPETSGSNRKEMVPGHVAACGQCIPPRGADFAEASDAERRN
jgi:hypothetical protein